jgi:hypothetical protein
VNLLVHLANQPDDAGRFLWVRIGNCRKQALLHAFDSQLPQIIESFGAGARVVESR